MLVVRVHPELLAAQKLPEKPSKTFWDDRLRAIVDHERHLAEQGTVILKFWLNMSKAEQRKQLARAHRGARQELEVQSRATSTSARCWDDYLDAYETVLACDVAAVGAVVCRAGRQQALLALASREARQRGARAARRRFSACRQGTRAVLKKAKARLLAERD